MWNVAFWQHKNASEKEAALCPACWSTFNLHLGRFSSKKSGRRGSGCSGQSFPERSGSSRSSSRSSSASIVRSTAEERVADSSRERRFVLQLHLKTRRQKRKGHRRQCRQSRFVSTATPLWRAVLVPPVWRQRGTLALQLSPAIPYELRQRGGSFF